MSKVFISYSHAEEDEKWKDQVVSQLNALQDEKLEVWVDRGIAAGDSWEAEIAGAIGSCDVALLLVSRHFLNSKYIKGKEVPPLLQRREKQGVRVVPVILSPCQWTRISWLKQIQARPKDGHPLSGMSEHDTESALSVLAGEIADLIAARQEQGAAEDAEETDADGPEVSPATALQKELVRLLAKCWNDANFQRFAKGFRPGLGHSEYFNALCASSDPYGDLMDARIALLKAGLSTASPSLDISNAVALSALVLYERYVALQGAGDGEISAANLLMAAVQASARHGTDTVIKGDDAAGKAPSNAALSAGAFTAYRKDAEADPEWEEVKRSLNFSAEVLMESIGELSYRAMRDKFAVREVKLAARHPRISEADLRKKLQKAERELGGRFVYFVEQGDASNLACKYKDRIETEFQVRTVVWKEGKEAYDAAAQIEVILENLFGTALPEAESGKPPAAGEEGLGGG